MSADNQVENGINDQAIPAIKAMPAPTRGGGHAKAELGRG